MNDLISRQAAIEAIECLEMFLDKQCDRERTKARGFSDNDIWAAVNMAYDALIAEKVGKWVEFDSAEDKYDVIKCPFCKHTFTVDSYHWTDIGFIKDDFKYCPNCGARTDYWETRDEAVERWNRRVEDEPDK